MSKDDLIRQRFVRKQSQSQRKQVAKDREQATLRLLFPFAEYLDRSLPRRSTQAGLIVRLDQNNRHVGKGSCFFIEVRGIHWCVTARHVICESDRDIVQVENLNGLYAVIGNEAKKKVVSLSGMCFLADLQLDLAAFPLERNQVTALGKVFYPIPKDTFVESLAWVIIGFPGRRNVQRDKTQKLVRHLLRLLLYSPNALPKKTLDTTRSPADFRAFDYHHAQTRTESGELVEAPDIHGMSGSPVLGARMLYGMVDWNLEGMLIEYHAKESRVVILRLSAIVRAIEELIEFVIKSTPEVLRQDQFAV